MSSHSDVTVVGTIVFDIFITGVNKLPNYGQAVKLNSLPIYSGGCGLNTSIVLSKLGVKTSLIGSVGTDLFGNFLLDHLRKNGVKTVLTTQSSKESTSVSILFINKRKERSYFHLVGANSKIKINRKELNTIFNSRIFHIGGVNLLPSLDGKPMGEILKKVKSKNTITSVDLAWDVDNKWMEKLKYSLPFIDILMGNEDEIKKLTESSSFKKSFEILHRLGVKIVVAKLGNKGSLVSKENMIIKVEPFNVKVKDTTGAGDAFAGGFLYGILNNKNLYECALIGNYCGALAITEYGSTTAFQKFKELELISKVSRLS